MNNNLLQIRDFQVRFINGQIINEPIENIEQLYQIIHTYGRGIISKISFYFHDNQRYFHNIILRNSDEHINDRFIVEFYRDYDNSQHIELSYQEQYNDYQSVINILQNNNLDILLAPFIINPFNPTIIT
jgi:hypothetical protein